MPQMAMAASSGQARASQVLLQTRQHRQENILVGGLHMSMLQKADALNGGQEQ